MSKGKPWANLLRKRERGSGLSKAAEQIRQRCKERLDPFPILAAMIEANEIDVLQSIKVVRELRQRGMLVCVIAADVGPQIRWASV